MSGFQNVPAVSVSAYRTRSEVETARADRPAFLVEMPMMDPLEVEDGLAMKEAGPVEVQVGLVGLASETRTSSALRP